MEEFDYEELVKATQSFSPSRLIGKGSHGAVYQGILQDNKVVVAVKRSSINGVVEAQRDSLKKLDNEISILSSLRESSHIISFLGASSHDSAKNDKLLVMEFMPMVLCMIYYMLQPPHLRGLNVSRSLCKSQERWTAKLADFGLAVSPTDNSLSQVTQPAGTIGYLDPCYTAPNKLSTKNDVFSLGVVFLEVISCRKVIDVTKTPASIVEWAIPLVEKQRVMEICDPRIPFPTYMEGMIRRILSVASRCFSENEDRRPSVGEIIMAMETCPIERVRTISTPWITILQNLVSNKRRRKWTRQCRAIYATHEGEINSDVSTVKIMSLKEILAAVDD
ncbi:hypothetical protein REPUB_Repub01dG0254900 [Reevesia pubescens]